ncbi:MAG: FRG domain-containing protein [Candidatus Sulfotelmatobacter sp.]
MNGQWRGTFSDTNGGGDILINIDEREMNYQGVAYLHPKNFALPRSAAFFKTKDKSARGRFRTEALLPLDPATWNVTSWETLKANFPNIAFSKYADVDISSDDTALTLSWTTDLGFIGNCALPKSKADRPSELKATQLSWDGFKLYVSGLKGKRFLFRGQSKPHRLRTSFHRSGRSDISRYHREDIPALLRHLSARTKHVFDVSVPDEFGAFLNLIQHHGYPTPLLDWTYSPFVAAFFAYRNITNEVAGKADPNDWVRVFVFDQEQWKVDWQQILLLLFPSPNFSVGEFLAIENERMIPQQGASTVTSVDDIESYIKSKETATKKYLSAIDLPVRDRRDVVRELRYMGITAGSLFPGLDGACEELKERNFEI